MSRVAARLWLAVVLGAVVYLIQRVETGMTFRTDLMALLPVPEQDTAAQRAQDLVTKAISRQLMLLVGHQDRTAAREAAGTLGGVLTGSRLVERSDTDIDTDRIRRIGAFYAPYRAGLLSDTDRDLLRAGRGPALATRALSQVFGFVGLGDAAMLRNDPFLLLPSFFAGLPLPMSRLAPDEGMLSVVQDNKTWVLVAGHLTQEAYALDVQRRLSAVLDPAIERLHAQYPDLEVLRLGAVFFARAGAEEAMSETSLIGVVSTIGIIVVLLAAFRALGPVWLSLLVIAVGVMTALAGSLLVFGELHVGALLFGVSLIGVAVDYSLQYCSETFTAETSARDRLRRVRWGITLGTATTVIGYLTLLLAPFPGLRQVAVFSAIGLLAAWLTVVLWLPVLDCGSPARHGAWMLLLSSRFLWLWQSRRLAGRRNGILAAVVVLAGIGLTRFHTDDDVRRMQALSPDLVAQQVHLQKLIGSDGGGQFFLVSAPDAEAALRSEEILGERLQALVVSGALAGFRSPARYIPSAQRQRENRALGDSELGESARREQFRRFGLQAPAQAAAVEPAVLTLAVAMPPGGPLDFLSMLVADDGQGGTSHVVMLDRIRQRDAVAAGGTGIAAAHFVDPAGSFSAVLGKYRSRAMALLALSAALMAPVLAFRFEPRRTFWIMLAPVLAVALTPGLRALAGAGFSFFDGIALVLILSVGVDYTVFLAETSGERRAVTMLAVGLAAATAMLSFGLLALSQVQAVQHFGATMLVGVLLAALLAPMARH